MVKIIDLKKTYKNFTLNCSIEVGEGRITGLIGQNGAGKSTVFKSILGLITPESGSVSVFGKDVKDLTAYDKEKMGVVLSDSGFSGYFTVKDIIPILKNLYREFDVEYFKKEAERFGLPFDKKIKDFSSGMKVKLKILVAVSHNAQLLLLDEPTAGLDVVARDEVLLILREYMEKNEKVSILISSHISSDLESLCDDIYMINAGNIILHEDTDVLLSGYAIIKVNGAVYNTLDKSCIISEKEESYGHICLTDQMNFYVENYPQIVIEKCGIDEIITMMIKGNRV